MTEKKIIELMKSGDFSLMYHDNGYCTIHKGHIKYEDSETGVIELPDKEFGYVPSEVVLLVKALKGKVDSNDRAYEG